MVAVLFGMVLGAIYLVVKQAKEPAPYHPVGTKMVRLSWAAFVVIIVGIIAVGVMAGDEGLVGTALLSPLVAALVAGPFWLIGKAVCWWGEAERELSDRG